MRQLDSERAAAVARAIQRIGEDHGVPLRIRLPGSLRRNYLAMPTGGDDAPVVIYRPSSVGEAGDFFVTGLADRETYRQYQSAEQQGLLDDPAVQALIAVLAAIALGYAISSVRPAHQEVIVQRS